MKRLLLTAVLTLTGCGAPTVDTPSDTPLQTVTVTRRDVTEVVALPGSVVASPSFTVAAPASGSVTHLVTPGTPLPAGTPLAKIGTALIRTPVNAVLHRWSTSPTSTGMPIAELTYVGFGQTVSLPPQDAYRMLAGRLAGRASITGGPSAFDCPILPAPPPEPGQVAVVCAIPPTVTAFAGLTGTVAISSRQVSDVLTLPVTAVSGTAQSGAVSLVDAAGRVSVVTVGLGITDGNVVEVTSGLAEGDVVLAIAPALDGIP